MPATQPNLYAYPSVEALAPALRSYIIKAQNEGIARHDAFKIAVSGGSLPKTLAQALLQGNDAADADSKPKFDKWEIFFADERAVPLDHADSNYAAVKAELLDKIPAELGVPQVRAISSDPKLLDNLEELADDYEQSMIQSFATKDSVRHCIFDLILLGCGPDGHTCSLFPGHALLRETDRWVAYLDDSPKPPPKRITFTLPVVTHAVQVAFVATGGGKKEIMKQIFDGPGDLPCGIVNNEVGERASWFVDEPAVEGVAFPKRAYL